MADKLLDRYVKQQMEEADKDGNCIVDLNEVIFKMT
jgi:hypothetical protein